MKIERIISRSTPRYQYTHYVTYEKLLDGYVHDVYGECYNWMKETNISGLIAGHSVYFKSEQDALMFVLKFG